MDLAILLVLGFLALGYTFAPSLARLLVRYRALQLHQGPDADRLREEWAAVLWELGSRREQLFFALALFKNFQKLQTEIEFRAVDGADLDSRIEHRVLEEIHRVRAKLEVQERKRYEQSERHRLRREKEEEDLRAKLDAERRDFARVRTELEKKDVFCSASGS